MFVAAFTGDTRSIFTGFCSILSVSFEMSFIGIMFGSPAPYWLSNFSLLFFLKKLIQSVALGIYILDASIVVFAVFTNKGSI